MNVILNRLFIANVSKLNLNKIHSNAALIENSINVHNRNPRNLELMRIARKPTGYHLEKHIPEYWHKFTIVKTSKHTSFEIQHFENGLVIQASTKEWPIKRRLYRWTDTAAYLNLGRILARRCLESGIFFVYVDPELSDCEKTTLALSKMEEEGLMLTEPGRYTKPNPWDVLRPEKPWEIVES